MSKENKQQIQKNHPILGGTMPHQINAPSFEKSDKLKVPFVNKYGVVIGDSEYESEQSPLENWSKDVDPAIMSGSEWVHPTNDIGWNTPENRELIEDEIEPTKPFRHPTYDSSYGKD